MDRFALLNALLHAMVLLVGAGIGSFLNVVIYRLPLGISVNNPRRSFCPSCKTQIPWYHNLPVITWLLLRGKCASCGSGIAFRYFFVEVLTAALFYAAFLHSTAIYGNPWPFMADWWPVTISLWIFLALLVSGTFIDIDHFILPHEITFGGMFAGMLCAFWAPSLVEQETHLMGLLISFLSAALGLGLLWSVVILGKVLFGKLRYKQKATPMFGLKKAIGIFVGWKWLDGNASWSITQPDDSLPPVFTIQDKAKPTVHPWEDIFNSEKDRLVVECTQLTINQQEWSEATFVASMDNIVVKQSDKPNETIDWETSKIVKGVASSVVVSREAMGLGDVFFLAMIGAFTGWKGVLFTIFAASVLGSIFAIVPRLLGKAEWTAKLPFGPYLAGGAIIWVFYGPQWVNWYLGWANLNRDFGIE